MKLEEFFYRIQTQGAEAINTFKIIAQTYNEGKGFINLTSDEIVEILIDRVKFWSHSYYKDRKEELGYLANAGIISIANISASNNVNKGINFVNENLDSLIQKSAPEKVDIISLSIPVAQEIVESKIPDYEAYS